jgi:hypothetical protein
MIAEIIPEAYDAYGRQVSQPFLRRKGPHPTFPMGRYVSQPLTVRCQTIRKVRTFLATCKYVSDKELFGKRDYWQPPEDFEERKKGNCEDFALWTWRQLLNMGYEARFIGGFVRSLRRRTRMGRILPGRQVLSGGTSTLQSRRCDSSAVCL